MASTTTPALADGGRTDGPDGAPASAQAWVQRAISAIESRPMPALGVLLAASGLLLLWMGRGLSFFYDDWDFVTHDYGGGLHSLFVAHVGNISIFPVAVYKVLFHLVGLHHYAAFRLVVIGLHLVCGALVYVLAARRIRAAAALLAAALILFLGVAWEDLLWGFQVGYLLSAAGGLAAWVLLDHRDHRRRWAPVAATLCLVLAVGSSSLGIALVVGIAVELAWSRRWRDGWIVVVPVLLYALWYLGYGESQVTSAGLIHAPGFAEDLAAAAFGGLAGRGLDWGRPLALLGLLILLRRLSRPLPVSPRLAGLLATAFALWTVTAIARSTISQPEASRYVYLGAIVVVLTGVELLRDVEVTWLVTALASAVVFGCAVAGITALHDGSTNLRSTSRTVTAELGALEVARAYAPSGYQPDAHLAPQIIAGPYLHTVRAIGSSPADTPAEIAGADPGSRAAADGVLMALEAPRLVAAELGSSSGAHAPTVVALASGRQVPNGDCVDLVPDPGATMTGVLSLPRRGVVLANRGRSAAGVGVRRFGDGFIAVAGTLGAHAVARLALVADTARHPWQLQLLSAARVLVCGRSA
jgi:hypothetical protein